MNRDTTSGRIETYRRLFKDTETSESEGASILGKVLSYYLEKFSEMLSVRHIDDCCYRGGWHDSKHYFIESINRKGENNA